MPGTDGNKWVDIMSGQMKMFALQHTPDTVRLYAVEELLYHRFTTLSASQSPKPVTESSVLLRH